MINPVLKDLFIYQLTEELKDFDLKADAWIGEEETDKSERFSFRIVTPKRLKKIVGREKLTSLKGIFLVKEKTMQSNIRLVTEKIEEILKKCARETWEKTAFALQDYFDWEYYNGSSGIHQYYRKDNIVSIKLKVIEIQKKIYKE